MNNQQLEFNDPNPDYSLTTADPMEMMLHILEAIGFDGDLAQDTLDLVAATNVWRMLIDVAEEEHGRNSRQYRQAVGKYRWLTGLIKSSRNVTHKNLPKWAEDWIRNQEQELAEYGK